MPNGVELAIVERPWLNNQRSISCIPCGEYKCKPRRYYSGGYEAIEVTNVPDRSYILFHVGNFVHNSKGCILPNFWHGYVKNQARGYNSRAAFDLLMSFYGGEKFKLSITNFQGGLLNT